MGDAFIGPSAVVFFLRDTLAVRDHAAACAGALPSGQIRAGFLGDWERVVVAAHRLLCLVCLARALGVHELAVFQAGAGVLLARFRSSSRAQDGVCLRKPPSGR